MRRYVAGGLDVPRAVEIALESVAADAVARHQGPGHVKQEIRFWWDGKEIHVTTDKRDSRVPLHTKFPWPPTATRRHDSMFKWLSRMLRAYEKPAPPDNSVGKENG
jgi:hypothetical protein